MKIEDLDEVAEVVIAARANGGSKVLKSKTWTYFFVHDKMIFMQLLLSKQIVLFYVLHILTQTSISLWRISDENAAINPGFLLL